MNEERQERINELCDRLRYLHPAAQGTTWRSDNGPLASLRSMENTTRRRAALLELGVRPRLVCNTAGSGLGPSYLAGPKPPLWGFPMLVSYRSDFQR